MKTVIALCLIFGSLSAGIISSNPESHSSCIIETSPGISFAVWKGEGIFASRCENGVWGSQEQLVESNSFCWSPVLAKTPKGELLLFYRIGSDPRHTISLMKTSSDGGLSWSKPEILPAGIVGPTKCKPVFDVDGNMICGSSSEAGSWQDDFKATACWIEILTPEGKWSKHGPLEIPGKQFGALEPALFWGSEGKLVFVCRDRSWKLGQKGWIWRAESIDGGKTWSELEATNLPNPDSGVAVVTVEKGHLIFFNDSHENRFPLTVGLSEDDGKTWVRLYNLEEESGEFPSAVVDSKGHVHVTYAYGKAHKQIKHVLIPKIL